MEMAKITSKGQITIPVEIRRKLRLQEGGKVLFFERDGGFLLTNESARNNGLSKKLSTLFGSVKDASFVEPADIPPDSGNPRGEW
jgi:looped-hinge helix DNA binding domain, AbrB family